MTKSVLFIGLDANLLDFSSPDFAAFPDLTAAKIAASIDASLAGMRARGYDADSCMVDLGETAEAMTLEYLQRKQYDCVVVGAGVRTVPRHFLLFEKLINVIHAHAPKAKICFNTKPEDTLEAVSRWIQD